MYSYFYDRTDRTPTALPPAGTRSYAPQTGRRARRKRAGRRPGMGRAIRRLCGFLVVIGCVSAAFLWSGRLEEQFALAFGFAGPSYWEADGWGELELPVPSDSVTMERAPTGDGTTLTLLGEPDGGALTRQEIYTKCLPSIVSIQGDSATVSSQGTGIVMTSDGYIITNHHVIDGAETVSVTLLDGSASYKARLVGSDTATDLAVLKVEAEGLTAAEFGDSSLLQVGDLALAVGNPLGEQLPGTMTDGIISYIDRSVNVDGYDMQLIQTSAALNSGNSGGALLNEYGQVVGVTTLKMSSDWDTIEALGFAIPTATVKTIVDDLIAHGYVTGRPTIGVTVCTISALPKDEGDDKPIEGLYVLSVEEASDAWKQGLREGDILLRANGQMLLEIEDLNDQKTGLQAGDTISLTVWRDGETFEVDVALVEQYLLES